jgi:hypothetical protein
MIFSANQLFSDDQAITATALSENVIDLGDSGTPYDAAAALHGDVGKGNPIPVLVQVTEDFATLTSLTVSIETGDASDLSDGTKLAEQTIVLADLTVGQQVAIQCLPNGLTGRYLGVRYTVTGTAATAGKITAGITMGNQTNVTGA